VLVLTIRFNRLLSAVGPTSEHAAFAASALANYFDIDPTTPRLLKIEAKEDVTLTRALWTIFKQGLADRIYFVMTGVPFLPNEAIPGRKGSVASFKGDFCSHYSDSAAETGHHYK
jgi:hypothetical protein